jgi:hypothetical protein
MIRHLNGTGENGTNQQNSTLRQTLKESYCSRFPAGDPFTMLGHDVTFTKISERINEGWKSCLRYVVQGGKRQRQIMLISRQHAWMVPTLHRSKINNKKSRFQTKEDNQCMQVGKFPATFSKPRQAFQGYA